MAGRDYATPFSLLHAASLLSQRARLLKFKSAIQLVVQSDSYVVDLGTGTGVLALLAAQARARRVTGIDVNPDSVEYARLAASSNGLQATVDFRVCHFREFVPEESADLVICEMLSSLMLVEQQVDACNYAVENFLKKEGTILPRNATVYVAPVECPSIWQRNLVEELDFPSSIEYTPSGSREID